jgi:hypothetical protein
MSNPGWPQDNELRRQFERHIRMYWFRKVLTALVTLLLVACAIVAITLVQRFNQVSDQYSREKLGLAEQLEKAKTEQLSLSEANAAMNQRLATSTDAASGEKKKLEGEKQQLDDSLRKSQRELSERETHLQTLVKEQENQKKEIATLNTDLGVEKNRVRELEEKLKVQTATPVVAASVAAFPPTDDLQHATIVLFCHLRDGYSMRDLARSSLQHLFVAHNYSSGMKVNPLRKLAFAQFNGTFQKDRLRTPDSTFSSISLQDDSIFSAWFQDAETVASSADLNTSSEELAAAFSLLKPEENPNPVSQLMLIVPGALRCPRLDTFQCANRISVFQIALDGQDAGDWSALCSQTGGLFQQFRISQNSGITPEESWQLESSLQVWAERVMLSLPVTAKKGP